MSLTSLSNKSLPFVLTTQCGVPKKGHVCPYQPKLTRRPGEPLPEMRGAAIQVEMDEVRLVVGSDVRVFTRLLMLTFPSSDPVHDVASPKPQNSGIPGILCY